MEPNGCGCTREWLSDRLRDGDDGGDKPEAAVRRQLVVVDCRPQAAYNNGHIVGAVSLTLPTLMLRRLVRGQLSTKSVVASIQQQLDPLDRATHVVFYDDNTSMPVGDVATCAVVVLMEKFREDGYRATVLDGGFESFRGVFPQQCTSSTTDDGDESTNGLCDRVDRLAIRTDNEYSIEYERQEKVMAQITNSAPTLVVPYLYLGNAQNAQDMDCLNANGIRYILNVTQNIPNRFEDNSKFHYLQIPISDHWSQNLSTYLPSAISFIDEARRLQCGVLVHCLAGISRSVTVTVAYLMSSLSLSLEDAYEFVKRCRPTASPSLNFMGQLMDFETTLRSSAVHKNRNGDCQIPVAEAVEQTENQ